MVEPKTTFSVRVLGSLLVENARRRAETVNETANSIFFIAANEAEEACTPRVDTNLVPIEM